MKKQIIAAAIAGLSMFAATANANVITIDDFNSGDQFVSSTTVGVPNSNTNAFRTLSTTLLQTSLPTQSDAQVANGGLHITNGGGEDSVVTVQWVLPANVLPSNAFNVQFLFTILDSDANVTTVDFALAGTHIALFNIPGNTHNADQAFSINRALLDAGGDLMMTLNGAVGWDMDMDFVGLSFDVPAPVNVPEPTSIALLGLGLVGLSAASRRRKA